MHTYACVYSTLGLQILRIRVNDKFLGKKSSIRKLQTFLTAETFAIANNLQNPYFPAYWKSISQIVAYNLTSNFIPHKHILILNNLYRVKKAKLVIEKAKKDEEIRLR